MTTPTTKPSIFVLVGIAAVLVATVATAEVQTTPPDPSKAEGVTYVVPPQVILSTQAAPEYPPAARQGRFEGTVRVEFTVLEDGSVGDVTVLECTAKKLGFEEATTEAVKKWRFVPAMLGTEPVRYTSQFRFSFRYPGVTDSGIVTGGMLLPPPEEQREDTGPSKEPRPPGAMGTGR